MSNQKSPSIIRAEEILRGKDAPAGEILELAKSLRGEKAFGHARKLLAMARRTSEVTEDSQWRVKFAQEHAFCTYKDPDLPAGRRLDDALKILRTVEDLEVTKNQETLGLAGAIYKRKWERDSQKINLERSLACYSRGYDQGAVNDLGYTGINAAFLFDVLAALEAKTAEETGTRSAVAMARAAQASQIRQDLTTALPPLLHQAGKEGLSRDWWFHVTVAESYFGLEQYEQALDWLKRARQIKGVAPWQLETTTRQLASLARHQAERKGDTKPFEQTRAWSVLREFVPEHEAGVRSAFAGKVGLGLSGGGFRASLFHIGVLARLAELDMLRHVEVLSCVSGGSILGAHYYLEVRKLLEEKPDAQITREDYIELVQRVAVDFLAGVQRNVRTRVAASVAANAKMIVLGNYSRSERVGDLYEEEIYSRVQDGGGNAPRWLNQLAVRPQGELEDFNPKYDNWRRRAKVPTLILNATTLNTGHNWQFTTAWMGEPGASNSFSHNIDANEQLRPLAYANAPAPHDRIRLGHAVAASACVPGLFEPLVLAGLYPGRIVRLVDGGVHDNQGIASLLEEDCTVLLLSDASGQMSSEPNPSRSVLGVPLRANSILMARVREAECTEIHSRLESSLLRGLMFLHLKMGLEAGAVAWRGCQEPAEVPETTDAARNLTEYGILRDIQALLAAIRTDLDSFSDTEAFALMTSGYRMTEHEFARSIAGFPHGPEPRVKWNFLQIEQPMKQIKGCESANEELTRRLKIGSQSAFKIWAQSAFLHWLALVMGCVAAAGLGWWTFTHWSLSLVTVGTIGLPVAVALGGLVLGKTVMGVVRYRETLERVGIGLGLALAGWLVARLHLCLFDPWFLRRGRIERLIDQGGSGPSADRS